MTRILSVAEAELGEARGGGGAAELWRGHVRADPRSQSSPPDCQAGLDPSLRDRAVVLNSNLGPRPREREAQADALEKRDLRLWPLTFGEHFTFIMGVIADGMAERPRSILMALMAFLVIMMPITLIIIILIIIIIIIVVIGSSEPESVCDDNAFADADAGALAGVARRGA
eukprot:3208236-Rhodomonas_salina.2